MHENLIHLDRLYGVDRQRDEVWDALRAMKATLAETQAKRDEAAAELAVLESRCVAASHAEGEVQASLDKYLARRARTRKQLDAGAIPDFLAAEKQVANYSEIIDGLESDVLDRMDSREQLERKRNGVKDRFTRLSERASRLEQELATEGKALQDRLTELNRDRKIQIEAVPRHVFRPYDALRRTHRDALTYLQGAVCEACRMHHPPQVVLEVRRGVKVHRCRGCTRYLIGISEEAPEVDADDGDAQADVAR